MLFYYIDLNLLLYSYVYFVSIAFCLISPKNVIFFSFRKMFSYIYIVLFNFELITSIYI